MKLLLRPAVPADVSTLLDIESQSFSHPHWRAKDFFADECIVAETDGQVVGFLVSREVSGANGEDPLEREILNVAVTPQFRRKGIASALLKRELRHNAVFFLEVRESNQTAQALYRKFGFAEIGRRSEYYQEPREGAIVMQMKKC